MQAELIALKSTWKHIKMTWKRHDRNAVCRRKLFCLQKKTHFNFIDTFDVCPIHWDIDTVRDA